MGKAKELDMNHTSHENEEKSKTTCRQMLKENAFLLVTLIFVVIGFAVGFGVRVTNPSRYALTWLKFPGELFMRCLNLMIIPIVVSSVIAGTARLDPRSNGKISLIAFIYIVSTNIIGTLIGALFVLAIRPGVSVISNSTTSRTFEATEAQDIFADLIRNLMPDNMVGAALYRARTKYNYQTSLQLVNNGTYSFNQTITTFTRSLVTSNRSNIIGLIAIAFLYGIATGLLGKQGKPMLEFFSAAKDATIKIMRWLLWFVPLGCASLIAASVAAIVDIQETFRMLGLFLLCNLLTQGLIQLIFLPGIYAIVTRTQPFKLYIYQFKAWCISFASTSTAVSIPEMLQACERYGMDHRVLQFVVPFSVTLSANGSAAFIAGSSLFLAQLENYPLTASVVVLIWILTSIAVMALPPVPSSSIVIIIVVTSSLNIPSTQIGLLLAVEWLLDRTRSSTNCTSHVFCTGTTMALCKKSLERADAARDSTSNHVDRKEGPATVTL